MTGWRHFGVELTSDSRKLLVSVRLADEYGAKCEVLDGYSVAYLPGYGDPVGEPDPHLVSLLRRSSAKGYYILANDTTDTGDGYIRFREDGPLKRVEELVDPEIDGGDPDQEQEQTIFDGPNSILPEFQLGAPGYWIVYSLLSHEGFPVVNPPG